ncbi:hypothetical protein DPMN_074171 [Dreissena polymorpha]|uniref:Uncharacterized protein n=1 Tax=Dreissena polymorpha TaxID=45954 RepID=A0A9D3YFQ1_DREPO|nr:hypothetical protein DPMN_074171 [Dreissena polymorpha]
MVEQVGDFYCLSKVLFIILTSFFEWFVQSWFCYRNPPQSHADWMKLLQQQQRLHEAEMSKWQDLLGASIVMVDQVHLLGASIFMVDQVHLLGASIVMVDQVHLLGASIVMVDQVHLLGASIVMVDQVHLLGASIVMVDQVHLLGASIVMVDQVHLVHFLVDSYSERIKLYAFP